MGRRRPPLAVALRIKYSLPPPTMCTLTHKRSCNQHLCLFVSVQIFSFGGLFFLFHFSLFTPSLLGWMLGNSSRLCKPVDLLTLLHRHCIPCEIICVIYKDLIYIFITKRPCDMYENNFNFLFEWFEHYFTRALFHYTPNYLLRANIRNKI